MVERGKVAFSLGKRAPAPAQPKAAPRAFADDDEPEVMAPAPSAAPPMSKAARKQHEEAEKLDPSAFDYDGVYDKMKAVERQMKAASKEADKERKSKYMDKFMQAAEVRERDRLRAESKMIQRERAAEGDAYAGKEAFVTSAYKEQQEELRRAEEEERIAEARERQKSRGVASFHQRMLKEESERRQKALEALERGERVVEEALRSPDWRAYLRRHGRMCLQFGYSDSGRYIGQVPASHLIERLKLRVADLAAFDAFLNGELRTLPGVQRVETLLAVATVKETAILPVAPATEE